MEETQNGVGKFLDPKEIISQLDLQPASVVADFGCGPGYFSIPFAKAVGEFGKVHSLDILPQALETVLGKAKNAGLVNVVATRANLEKNGGSKLEAGSVDWVVMKDILFQNQKKDVIIAEAYRILKSGGKVIVIEWDKQESAVGPAQELRISQIDLEKIFNEQKFIVERGVQAGDFHYAFVAVKQ
ncbi:MAG: class I SAM-dependent methyltransferase [Candidatus Moranbacteria bacterium]|nr:class I SAM-dependent methyltransferase [Candidatus Moranbacteria bacterium]